MRIKFTRWLKRCARRAWWWYSTAMPSHCYQLPSTRWLFWRTQSRWREKITTETYFFLFIAFIIIISIHVRTTLARDRDWGEGRGGGAHGKTGRRRSWKEKERIRIEEQMSSGRLLLHIMSAGNRIRCTGRFSVELISNLDRIKWS